MNLVLTLAIIGQLTVTSYRSVPKQTDSSPFRTSTGERVGNTGVAVSQDLLCGACRKLHGPCREPSYSKKLHYGQWVYIDQIGFKQVNDVMNKRHKNRMDVWVSTLSEEKAFHKRFKSKTLSVMKVKEAVCVPRE